MSSNPKTTIPFIGISIGDPNGVGPEVVLKCFSDKRMLDFCTPVIFANSKFISSQKNQFLNEPMSTQGIETGQPFIKGKINIVNVWNDVFEPQFGQSTTQGGQLALASLEAATQALIHNEIDALVTAPINKHNIQSDQFKFPGHTDYLAHKLSGKSLMFMISESLRVGLMTDHVPVNHVSEKITPELISEKIDLMEASLLRDFGIRQPKIAVLGLNPHTGDHGVIGEEDDKVLRPTLEKIASTGKMVFGPFSADSFFGSGQYTNYDAVLASYHDQGLIPFKTLSFGEGVNFTAGLSKVRTSPDHGTAYEIAGKGLANISSFRNAVYAACSILRERQSHDEITANPLKIKPKKPENKKHRFV